jgi:hypothetical protein
VVTCFRLANGPASDVRRQAVIYRGFLDAIEPDERVFHAADPGLWLARAALLAAER